MKKLIIVILLGTSACATQRGKDYYSGYKDCAGKVSGVFEYIEMLEKEQDHCFTKAYYEDQIGELQIRNSALESANKFLHKLVSACREDRAKNAPCVYKGEGHGE